MQLMSNDMRFGVGTSPDGKKRLVLNLGGEFSTNAEVGAYMKAQGERLIYFGTELAELPDDDAEDE